MPNTVLFNTAGSIALAVNYVIQGPYSDKFLSKEAAKILRVNADFYVRVDDAVLVIEEDVDLDEDDLDTGSSFDPSTTYYAYGCQPLTGTAPVFKISKNATYPSGGWTASNSRKIGGFETDVSANISESTVWDLRTVDIDGAATSDHDATHVKDGSDEIDGDHLDIDFTPSNYTPSTAPAEASDADHLAAHLAGIDDALATVAFASGYGVRWNSSTDVMTPGIISNGSFVAVSVENFPVQEKMRRCVTSHGATLAVEYYLHPDDSTLKEDGVTASNIDGTDGQVMVEVPLFYYLVCTDGNNKYFLVGERPFSLTLSDSSVRVAKRHEWFEEGGTLSEKKYIGAFEGVLWDADPTADYVDGTALGQYAAGDKIHSVAGYKPITYETRASFRTACALDAAYHQMGLWAHDAVMLLYLTEYQSWASQTDLPGYTEETETFNFGNHACKTGITKVLGNRSGSINWEDADAALRCTEDQTGLVVANSFRGIENFYGHVWKYLDGINIEFIGDPLTAANIYTCNNPDDWADGTDTDYVDTGDDLPLASEFQTDLHDGCLLPKTASGGSSSTYIRDYYDASTMAGWRVFKGGGSLTMSGSAGFASRNAIATSTNRNSATGGRSAA